MLGKVIRGDLYFHVSAAADVSIAQLSAMSEACEMTGLRPTEDFNVVKFGRGKSIVSLLSYANFFEDAFPRLEMVCTVNMTEKTFRQRSYSDDRNPPILHKKELLLSPSNPFRLLFEKLTEGLEKRGIRPDKAGLGFRKQWDEYLMSKGVEICNHEIVELVSDNY